MSKRGGTFTQFQWVKNIHIFHGEITVFDGEITIFGRLNRDSVGKIAIFAG